MSTSKHPITPVAGWREWVSLPSVGVPWLKAKLDTGARSSSLHAWEITEDTQDGHEVVSFWVHPWQRSTDDAVSVSAPVHDRREVRSSNGHLDTRPVVLMDVRLLGKVVTAEVTLTARDEMGFRMLIGREALRHGFLVDSGASYNGGRPGPETRRRNRGR